MRDKYLQNKTKYEKAILLASQNYIKEPKSKEDFVRNAQFQLDNIIGWVGVKEYECALIKAQCLVEALVLVVAQPDR